MRRVAAFFVALLGLAASGPAGHVRAEVHIGNNVFIGGHNFSHQRFDRHHRLHVTLYDHPIRGAGCVTYGGVKRCRLQRVPH